MAERGRGVREGDDVRRSPRHAYRQSGNRTPQRRSLKLSAGLVLRPPPSSAAATAATEDRPYARTTGTRSSLLAAAPRCARPGCHSRRGGAVDTTASSWWRPRPLFLQAVCSAGPVCTVTMHGAPQDAGLGFVLTPTPRQRQIGGAPRHPSSAQKPSAADFLKRAWRRRRNKTVAAAGPFRSPPQALEREVAPTAATPPS